MSSKTREALSEILDLIDKWRTDGVMEHWQYSQLFDVADTALAEPLRNCDVGTAEEQEERFHAFCNRYTVVDAQHCNGCLINNIQTEADCVFVWSQMPYKKGETE